MTDKEFKRLSRPQLIEVIYQFQIKLDELTAENALLKSELDDKHLHLARAGNIAEAALEVNKVMEAAQKAASQYLDEIKVLYSQIDNECDQLRLNAQKDAEKMLTAANAKAAETVAAARKQVAEMLASAQSEAAETLHRAKVEAGLISDKAARKKQAERELEAIISEFGSSFRK